MRTFIMFCALILVTTGCSSWGTDGCAEKSCCDKKINCVCCDGGKVCDCTPEKHCECSSCPFNKS